MHEHEAPERAERRKPRAEAGGVGGPALLSLQQQAGNRAVAGVVARAVEIDELTSKFDVRDDAKLNKGVRTEVEKALQGERKRPTDGEAPAEQTDGGGGTGGEAPAEEQQSTGGGANTLPPGGHATMEEEPS